jgi:alkaline phosphatase
MLKLGGAAAVCAAVGVAGRPAFPAAAGGLMLRAGIITDMHKTTMADNPIRKYSASLGKMRKFISGMNAVKPAFVIELGDFVDMLGPGTDPAENLREIESVFTSFNGPSYHVLGNHDFDNLKRDFVLKAMTNTGIPQGRTWYSWDAGGIHCVVLDADYTPGNYRPYDMNTPEDTFWTWKDTCIPPQELEWLRQDLRGSSLPVVVFTHQTLDRVDEQDHNIKNASAVRAVLEESGRVLAVISGHDHQGGYSNIKGIHYIVLNGNVGVSDSRPWDVTSRENGLGAESDNQFSVLEISRDRNGKFGLRLAGYGRQPGYVLERTL